MSSTTDFVSELDLVIRYFNISVQSFVFIFGMIGNILNIIVFLSLKTFRKNPCAFCMLILSISDSGILIFNTLPSIFVNIFKDYGDVNTMFPCQIPIAFGQVFGLMSHMIMCFAAIDQCKSTSIHEQRQGINLKYMRCFIIISIFVSILHGIPFLVFYNAQPLSGLNATACLPNDRNGPFSKYTIYVDFPIIDGFMPIFIMSVFGLIAFRNVRIMAKRRVHIIRLRLEQQLTAMVLIRILGVCITVIPFLIVYVIRYIISSHSNDPIVQKKLQLLNRVFTILFFVNYAVSENGVPSFVHYLFN
ncbi:unnamed protein product [Rotaria sp. Silwood2]|nr:unnamed protein product [Rotaria sp. Silwood2]CAF2953561.1 unnamed protein product [Rotaria sp. Silwood2]CAF3995006.1 unnamed protein product [Rotaria sp. Silwood2]CAF4260764.1 unnamed protein product [Rotaria sp. Silwood2]CAF4469066.1 unnamed protein product [Rotaria sp. Silwood2]